ncbi:uncharacterized protein LOC116139503 [Pistacia vera]|uniref:uncharacterized protein LOC116139503 n=1 Tax=Pistacia vera TaxID=55513 RepID=UPI001263A702|nr:uncharacterized protein LOC116139503 [Pistacia vera]
MILAVVSSMILVKRRMMMEVLPQRLRDMWKRWELRALVLVSLISQIVLIILGNRRKYNSGLLIKCIVWCVYLLADSVATMGLGVLLNNLGEIYENGASKFLDDNNELTTFWAPFFLLHLGGPDTITAYSLEDNELYLRHLFGLLVQTVSVIYIFLLAWSGSHLSFLAILMILVGCVKYGERTCALWLASSGQLRDSMLTDPDPGPNYPKFMEEFSLKHEEGFSVEAEEVKDAQVEIDVSAARPESSADDNNILRAHAFFQTFKCLFADLILSFQDRDKSQSFFQKLSHEDAFNVIAIELGFMYDLLYTKATAIHTRWGFGLRIITFTLTCMVFLIFFFADKNNYVKVDLSITFSLLVGAILLEIYAAFSLFLSDQASLWFRKHKKIPVLKPIITFLEPVVKLPRWSNSMGQYSLTCLCLREKSGPNKILRRLHMDQLWEKYRYKTSKEVPENLRKLIFKHGLKKCDKFKETNSRDIYTNRGIRALQKYYGETDPSPFDWSIMEVEFDQSIIIWHIATELCYYSGTQGKVSDISDYTNRKLSKLLSRFMLFLLIMYPSLLPVGIGLIRFRDTHSEARNFFKERKSNFSDTQSHVIEGCDPRRKKRIESYDDRRRKRIEACRMLLKVKTYVPPNKVKGDRSKSVLFDACKVASALNEEISDTKKRWKLIRDVWLEMLTFAASQGRGSQHASQLRRGGELLTHVWLLMAHFGMTDQFQIAQGHARAKLNVK